MGPGPRGLPPGPTSHPTPLTPQTTGLWQVHSRDHFPGGTLHGGSANSSAGAGMGGPFFSMDNGAFQNGLVTVSFELESTRCNGGGCVVIATISTIIARPPG